MDTPWFDFAFATQAEEEDGKGQKNWVEYATEWLQGQLIWS